MMFPFTSRSDWRWLPAFACLVSAAFAQSPAPDRSDEAAGRQFLVETLLAPAESQSSLIARLGGTHSKVVRDLLISWTREEIYLYQPSGGPSANAAVPVTLEDQQNADGKSRAIRVADGAPLQDAQGQNLSFAVSDLPSVNVDMKLRGVIQQTLNVIALNDDDPKVRQAAAVRLGLSQKQEYLEPLRSCLAREKTPEVRRALQESLALIAIHLGDSQERIAGLRDLGALRSIGSLDALRQIANDPAQDAAVAQAAREAIAQIDQHIKTVDFFGTLFRGVSLGMVLLIVALGLAITFGLMGVINMAHGEMIAVGAYTCYVIENLFSSGFAFTIELPFSVMGRQLGFGLHLPGLHATGWVYQSYFLLAIPLSFLASAVVGWILERLVIRFLYSRPLESLLATWGVSLFLQQCFRLVFGANNVQVNSPSWLLGNFTVDDIGFDYNRIFVIVFAVLIVLGTWLLLTRTPLGLLIRAVTQNRNMAACVGVRTERVNTLTFAFGSGLAGLAGAFLSQIGNVGPSLGQSYIVDSFMTVVVGGVGNIIGTVCSALGVGISDQILQQILGSPVLGKILVLGAIILFLQWKPGGLFPSRSRSLDE